MPDYQQGKIYKLISPHTDKVYVGSTTENYLSGRKSGHKSNYKNWTNNKKGSYISSFELFELGVDCVDIILLENFPCNSKNELHARERYWIECTANHVNKNIPTRTVKEKNKSYYQQNKEILKQYQQEYRKENKESVTEQKKAYYQQNKEAIAQHYQQNKDKINAKYHCVVCNCELSKHNKSIHQKSQKHLQNLEQNK
jgi:hypothetical protein